MQDGVHHARRLGRRLHAVQALAGVAQAVRDIGREQVRLGERPELEELVQDLLPEGERLEDVGVLSMVRTA